MPRNLMVCEPNPGVIDFQDAVYGPIAYDPVCLVRDAFLTWEPELELDVIVRYWEKAKKAHLPVDADFGEFWRALEWMGVQRHLKVLGIFARLNYRDGKPKYLEDTPRFLKYVGDAAKQAVTRGADVERGGGHASSRRWRASRGKPARRASPIASGRLPDAGRAAVSAPAAVSISRSRR